MSGNPSIGSAQQGGGSSYNPFGGSFGGGYSPPSTPSPSQPSLAPPTPPNNPTPAVMPQRGPHQPHSQQPWTPGPEQGAPWGGGGFFGRGGYPGDIPQDRMPMHGLPPQGPFGRREPPPGGPVWSQQGGIYNYDPNGQPEGQGGMFNRPPPPVFTPPDPGQIRQELMLRMQQMHPQPNTGLGAINPYEAGGPLTPGMRPG